jgi:hypothetical protein
VATKEKSQTHQGQLQMESVDSLGECSWSGQSGSEKRDEKAPELLVRDIGVANMAGKDAYNKRAKLYTYDPVAGEDDTRKLESVHRGLKLLCVHDKRKYNKRPQGGSGSAPAAAKSAPAAAKSAIVAAMSVLAAAKSAPVVAKSAPLVRSKSVPAATKSAPAASKSVAASKSAKPASKSAKPATKSAKPATKSAKPASKSAKASSKSAAVAAKCTAALRAQNAGVAAKKKKKKKQQQKKTATKKSAPRAKRAKESIVGVFL